MPATRYPRIAPDLDALELTLVRSIENIRETLPPNHRQSKDLSTIAFPSGQNNDKAGTVSPGAEKTLARRGSVSTECFWRNREAKYEGGYLVGRVATEEKFTSQDSSWKKHITESEALALENQIESIRQDMRDLADAKQRRDQALIGRGGRGGSSGRKLRRVNGVLPQKRADYSVPGSNSEAAGFGDLQIQTTKDVKTNSIESGSMTNSKNHPPSNTEQPSLHTIGLPHARKIYKDTRPILLTDPKVHDQLSYHCLSKPAPHYRSGILLPSPALVPATSNLEITKPGHSRKRDFDQEPSRQNIAREKSTGSDSSHESQHHSTGFKAVRKPQIPGGKKVRFAGRLVSSEKSTPEERYGRKSDLVYNSSSSLSSLSSTLPSSLSATVSTSLDEGQETSESESQLSFSLNSEESEGVIHALPSPKAPLGSPSQARKGSPWDIPLTPRKPQRSAIKEVKENDQKNQGAFLESYSLEDDSARETFEKKHSPGRSPGLTRDGLKNPIATSASPQHSSPHQSSLNRSTGSIRALLRKHSGKLLNKFSWRGNRAGGLSETPREIREESKCVGCREVFDTSSLIQVSEKCLHCYCKACLEAMFVQALKDPHNACPVKCCGSNLIDVSLATGLLSRSKIARYKQLPVKSSGPT